MPIRRIHAPLPPADQKPSSPSPQSAEQLAQRPTAAQAPDGERHAPACYEVGYRKPPLHTRFQPGRSGNPKGRPKAAKGLKTIARETLTQKVAVRTATGEKKMSRIEALLHKTAELAMKGNARALAEVLKLYAAAVPDAAASDSSASDEDLSATDLAILEALRSSWSPEGGDE